jgi:RimJ/RimL family protein N-acetyltransferase
MTTAVSEQSPPADSRPRLPIGRAVLRDGSVVHIRPIGPEDKELLRVGFQRLSEESRYRRFLRPVKRLSEHDQTYFTEVDHVNHEALVALGPHGSEPVGVARFIRLPDPQAAEVAIAVIDEWQARGVGTLLLHELVERARAVGVRRFTATCLADNREAIDLLQQLGATRIEGSDAGVVELTIQLPDEVLQEGGLRTALHQATRSTRRSHWRLSGTASRWPSTPSPRRV